MSFQAMAWAMQQRLHCTEKMILICLADLADVEANECFPTQKYLAEQAGLSRVTINQTLTALEKQGLIEKQRRKHPNGGERSCVYKLAVPPGVYPSLTPEQTTDTTPVSEDNTKNLLLEPITKKNARARDSNRFGKKKLVKITNQDPRWPMVKDRFRAEHGRSLNVSEYYAPEEWLQEQVA